MAGTKLHKQPYTLPLLMVMETKDVRLAPAHAVYVAVSSIFNAKFAPNCATVTPKMYIINDDVRIRTYGLPLHFTNEIVPHMLGDKGHFNWASLR